ncbi:MAG: preprotein translocase subunit SecE [Clostridiales bacterium]|jgi:preprotein translocase subunit SecE|nr:preprotein translocase subunit SecE [Clostridiales bacterium]
MDDNGNEKVSSINDADDAKKNDKKPHQPPDKQENKLLRWFHAKYVEYVSEFKKIVWPSREDLVKQSLTVIAVSLIFGAYIAILDGGFNFLFTQFASWVTASF